MRGLREIQRLAWSVSGKRRKGMVKILAHRLGNVGKDSGMRLELEKRSLIKESFGPANLHPLRLLKMQELIVCQALDSPWHASDRIDQRTWPR